MSEHRSLTGIVLDEALSLTLHEVCDICGIEEALVIEMVNEGVAEPIDPATTPWQFSGVAVTRLRTAYRLQRDLHINLAGAALALDLLEEIKGWYVEEINVHFRAIAGNEKTLVENLLIPALEKILPCKFDAVEWWPEGKAPETPRAKDVEEQASLRGLFRRWFGSD